MIDRARERQIKIGTGLGVVGSLMICAAYLGVSLGRLDATGPLYQAANALGSVLLFFSFRFITGPIQGRF